MDIERFYKEFEQVCASGQPEGIIGFLRSSLDAAEKEDDRHALVSILNELAGYCRNASRYDEAILAAERALAEMRALGYDNTVHYGTTLLNAATAYRVSGDNGRALEQFTQALAIFQASLPGDDYRLAAVYNNVSSIYEQAGQYADALQTLQRALDIMLRHPGMEEQAAIVQTNLAMILFEMNHEAEAVSELEKALGLFRGTDGGRKPGPHYAAALAGAGEAYVRMRRFSEAVDVYEEALGRINSAFGRNRDWAVTCGNCALAYEGLGQKAKADEYRRIAGEVRKELGLA